MCQPYEKLRVVHPSAKRITREDFGRKSPPSSFRCRPRPAGRKSVCFPSSSLLGLLCHCLPNGFLSQSQKGRKKVLLNGEVTRTRVENRRYGEKRKKTLFGWPLLLLRSTHPKAELDSLSSFPRKCLSPLHFFGGDGRGYRSQEETSVLSSSSPFPLTSDIALLPFRYFSWSGEGGVDIKRDGNGGERRKRELGYENKNKRKSLAEGRKRTLRYLGGCRGNCAV